MKLKQILKIRADLVRLQTKVSGIQETIVQALSEIDEIFREESTDDMDTSDKKVVGVSMKSDTKLWLRSVEDCLGALKEFQPITMTSLARKLGVSKYRTSRLLEELETLGLVEVQGNIWRTKG